MIPWRKRIDHRFEALASWLGDHAGKALLLSLLVLMIAASGVRFLKIDTSNEAFLHADDPTLVTYNEFRQQFGRDELIALMITPKEVFDPVFLTTLRELHRDLETEVPYVDEVTSLINGRVTKGYEDELIVEDLFEVWPQTQSEWQSIQDYAVSNPLYQNLLISEDATATSVVIRTQAYVYPGESGFSENDLETDGFDDFASESDNVDLATFEDSGFEETGLQAPRLLNDAENAAAIKAVRQVIAKYNSPDFPIQIAGSPIITHDLKSSLMRDLPRYMLLALVIIGGLLFVLFRRLSGVLIPLAIMFASLFTTVGLMGWTGTPFTVPTQILPSFLLAVCVGAAIHLMAIFYRDFDRTRSKQKSLAYALGHSGLPIVMTSLTTSGGLISFAGAELAPLAALGIFASTGVLVALAYTLIALPSLILLMPLKPKPQSLALASNGTVNEESNSNTFATPRENKSSSSENRLQLWLDRFLTHCGDFAAKRPSTVIVGAALIFVLSVASISQLHFSHNILAWFPDSSPTKQATAQIDHRMKGSVSLEVVVDTHRANGLYDPNILMGLQKAGEELKAYNDEFVFVGQTTSLSDIVKEIHRALNEDQPEFYVVPDDAQVIAQEIFLFSNSSAEDLEEVVDTQYSQARLTAKVPFVDSVSYLQFFNTMETRITELFPEDVELTFTGLLILLSRTINAVMISTVESYLIASVVITLLMILLIGEWRAGLLSMIPNLFPIFVTLGLMGLLDIPLDMFTLLIGSIAIGLAVDDTIHFMHNFRRYFQETGSSFEAIHHTLQTTGRAMLFTSLVLASGFLNLTLSSMNNLTNFGLLTAFAIVMALLSDILLAPALMTVAYRKLSKAQESPQRKIA